MTDPVEEFKSEPSAKAKELENLKLLNERAVQRLVALGAGVDPDSLYRERGRALEAYIYTHVFTEAQREDFNIMWQKDLNRQLLELEKRARRHALSKGVSRPSGGTVSNKLWRPGS